MKEYQTPTPDILPPAQSGLPPAADYQAQQQFILQQPQPQLVYYPQQHLSDHPPPIINIPPIQPDNQYLQNMIQENTRLLNYARVIKWLSIIDAILLSFYLLVGIWPIIFLIFLALTGFLAGRKLNWKFGIAYLIYLILSIFLRIVLIALFEEFAIFAILGVFIVLFEIVIIYITVRFILMVKKLTDEERQLLLNIMNSNADIDQPQGMILIQSGPPQPSGQQHNQMPIQYPGQYQQENTGLYPTYQYPNT